MLKDFFGSLWRLTPAVIRRRAVRLGQKRFTVTAGETALRRELLEEIGLEVADVKLLFIRTLRRPPQIEMYFRAQPLGRAEPCSFEIKRADWFEIDALPEELSNDQRRLIKRAMDDREKSVE